jgi:hypothetical protein
MIILKQRKAFSMITAIVIIILMSSVAVLITNISGKIVKETTTQYQREQAIILAKSYTNYAILAISGNNRSSHCLETINGTTDGIYSARIQIAYIGENYQINNCSDTRELGYTNLDNNNSANPLTVIIDAYIDYDDLDDPNNRQFTYHRRTVQKI